MVAVGWPENQNEEWITTAITEHIVELDRLGWMVIHPLWCPGNLLKCPVTQLCRDLESAPRTGRFWGRAESAKDRYTLKLGEPVPPDIHGTSRRTGYHFQKSTPRPS